jgi:hypothetical protein
LIRAETFILRPNCGHSEVLASPKKIPAFGVEAKIPRIWALLAELFRALSSSKLLCGAKTGDLTAQSDKTGQQPFFFLLRFDRRNNDHKEEAHGEPRIGISAHDVLGVATFPAQYDGGGDGNWLWRTGVKHGPGCRNVSP